jgi:UDP-N-acetylglucosamine 2-epimerase (non-hydrolysing)
MKICIVAGARPNFMKIAPIIRAINGRNQSIDDPIKYVLVHTGQHYDEEMSRFFFDDLGIPAPDINLDVGSASHPLQTAEIMKGFEKVCLQEKPTHVLVVGDVNSTIACALVASKMGIKTIHIEAGLRSFDRSMPEEINRILTDAISDFLFTTEESANKNLQREGIPEEKIYFVGNVMIDTLLKNKKKAEQSDILYRLGLTNTQPNNSRKPINPTKRYAVLTLHRPSNVDDEEAFQGIIEALTEVSKQIPVIFPAHPRTFHRITELLLQKYFNWTIYNSTNSRNPSIPTNPGVAINLIHPLGYLDFLHLMAHAKLVLTDSGGIQEETAILGIPCVTIRNNTERPITVTHGTNLVAGVKKENIIKASLSQLVKANASSKQIKPINPIKPNIPPLWDGKAAERIVDILLRSEES